MVVAPFCDCRLCCRDEMEIKKTAHAGRLFFCPSAVGRGAYIFASSESHRNAHRTPPPLRPYHYTTEPTNATQRATESDRANDQKHRRRTAHTGPAAPTQGGRGAEKDRHRQSRERSKFGSMFVKISPVKISKFSRSNSRLQHFRDSVLQAQRSTSAHQEDCSE